MTLPLEEDSTPLVAWSLALSGSDSGDGAQPEVEFCGLHVRVQLIQDHRIPARPGLPPGAAEKVGVGKMARPQKARLPQGTKGRKAPWQTNAKMKQEGAPPRFSQTSSRLLAERMKEARMRASLV
ncbi:MAG: hypothetical protein V8T29_01375 [Oscillospiraceae bacterium]